MIWIIDGYDTHTPLCWDCALFRVLGYTERYDEKRNSWFPKLLSLDMLYPQIISHCIDDDMMTFDYESVFGSSVGGLMLCAVCLVPFENWRYSKVYTTSFNTISPPYYNYFWRYFERIFKELHKKWNKYFNLQNHEIKSVKELKKTLMLIFS